MNIEEDEGKYEVIKKFDEDNKVYRKFVLQDGKIIGMTLAGEDRAGVILNLMRNGVDVSSFKEKLLDNQLGYADMPEDVRWMLLCDDVVLGVL